MRVPEPDREKVLLSAGQAGSFEGGRAVVGLWGDRSPKLLEEIAQLRKINEVLAGQVHQCRTYHTTNAEMASNYTRIVYHEPPSFVADNAPPGQPATLKAAPLSDATLR